MKTKFVLFSLCFVAFSSILSAQCGNKTKAVNANYHPIGNIVEVAASNDQFNTLVAAVKQADLVSTLQSAGPFTVFAPTNTAFAKLPKGTVSTLLQAENKKKLAKILTYHVVAGKFEAADVVAAIKKGHGSFTIKTVSGDELVATMNNGAVILTDENGGVAGITATDVQASNGIIHVIDTVVLPK